MPGDSQPMTFYLSFPGQGVFVHSAGSADFAREVVIRDEKKRMLGGLRAFRWIYVSA
jgi:hypothetical protein